MHRSYRMFPGAPYLRFAVVRIDADPSDTHAADAVTTDPESGEVPDLDECEDHEAEDRALDLANPDDGALVEVFYVWAKDACAARLAVANGGGHYTRSFFAGHTPAGQHTEVTLDEGEE